MCHLQVQGSMNSRLTIGDVAIIMGDQWAAENGIVRGITDPMQKPPPEWIAAAKKVVAEGRGSSNVGEVTPDSTLGQASTMKLEPPALSRPH